MAKIPDQVAGFRIRSGQPLGIGTFGRTFLATRDGAWALLKLLRRGERLTLSDDEYDRLSADPRVLGFKREVVSEDGFVTLTAVRPTATLLGVVAGGSPLQQEAERAALAIDPKKGSSLALLRSSTLERVHLLRDLAQALTGLGQSGWWLPHLSPWNVLVVGEDDGARLIPCDVGLGYDDDPELVAERLHEDAMVYLAPELLASLLGRSPAPSDLAPCAVYAFGATAWTLLNDQPVIPLGTAGRELTPAELASAPPRKVRALGNGGVSVAPNQRLSTELSSLLARTLATEPARRPSLAEVARELDTLLSERRVTWTPPPGWGPYALTAALVITLVWWIVGLPPPPTGRLRALEAFAAATHENDLDQRDAALRTAQVVIGGQEVPLPETKRLLALNGWLRWQARAQSGKPGLALDVVTAIEDDAIAGYEDPLGQHLRFLAGFLRRWELGADARARGDEHLDALVADPTASPELRALAQAARALSPTDGELGSPQEVAAWLEAATRASSPAGFLVSPQPIVDYGELGLTLVANPISLQASWVGELIAGRILVRQGKLPAGVERLATVHGRIPIYAAQVTLGYAYVLQGGAATAKGDRLLEEARAIRNDSALHLTRARVALRLGRYAAARAALDDAISVEPPRPAAAARVRWEVQLLRRETTFREAVALADRGAPAAEPKLRGALAAARASEDDKAQLLIPDLTLALAVFLAGQGREGEARRLVWGLYDAKVLDEEWTQLPALTPVPPTRRRSTIRRLLFRGLQEQARAAVEATGPVKAERDLMRQRYRRLATKTPLEPEEARFRAWFALALARVARSRSPSAPYKTKLAEELEAHRKALEAVLAQVDPPATQRAAQEAEAWLLRAALVHAEGQAPADRLALLSRATQLPRSGRELKLRQSVGLALKRTVDGLLAKRRQAWNAIAPEAPAFDAAQAKADEVVLTAALKALGARPDEDALILGRCWHVLALLHWSQGAEAKGFQAASTGLKLLNGSVGEPEADELTKQIDYAAGLAAFRSTRKDLPLKPSRIEFASDALARSLGEAGYAPLLASLKEGDYHPFGPAGREQAPLYWLARTRAAVAGADKAAWAEVVALYQAFGRLLGDKAVPPGAKAWKAELAAAEAKTAKKEQE